MTTTMLIRRETAANAASSPVTLAAGEPGFETDTGVFKIGDGATAWDSLATKYRYVQQSRSISTTAPLTGGGDLSADRTISMPAATSTANGYLSSTDWATFNGKVPSTRTINGYDLSTDRTLTASDLGLGSVENTALSTWAGTTNITTIGTLGVDVTCSKSSSTLFLNDTRVNAANRNWCFTVTYAAFGDMELRVSNAAGGNPYSAGTTLMTFAATKVRINSTDLSRTAALEVSGGGTNAQMSLLDSTNSSWVVWSASLASGGKPYMGTISNHPFYFITNNAYAFGAAASGGFSIGSTLYSTDAGQNNLLVEGTVKSADVQPRTNDTYYLGKNSATSPLAWKGLVLKDTTDGKLYLIRVTNGSLAISEIV